MPKKRYPPSTIPDTMIKRSESPYLPDDCSFIDLYTRDELQR